VKWPRTCDVASRVTWPRVWRGRDALPRVRRSTSVEREYANKDARKASWGVPEVKCRRAGERNPTTPLTQECVPDVQRRSRGSATLPRHMRKNAFQTRYAGHGERNPTAPHTQECVPDVQRRSRGSATLSRHMRKNVFQRCNGGRRGSATLPRRIPKNAFQTCNAGR